MKNLDDYLASLHLLELMQDTRKTLEERVDYWRSLMELDCGWWGNETFKSFGITAARFAIAKNAETGVRRSAQSADDLAQDVLLAFFEGVGRIESNPKAWVFGLAINLSKRMFKREGHYLFAKSIEDLPKKKQLRYVPKDGRPRPPKADLVRDAVSKLPAASRAVAELYLDGRSREDIARTLRMTRGNVRQHLFRLTRRLKKLAG